MRFFSFKYRIAIVVFLLEIIMLGLVLWRFESVSKGHLRSDYFTSSQACFKMLSQPSRVALINEEFSELGAYFTIARQNPQIDEIILADYRKVVVVSTTPLFLGQLLPPLNDGEYTSWQQKEIINPSGRLGWLAVKFSTRQLHDALYRARYQGLIIALISLVVIAIAGLAIGFLLTRRLEKLDAAARKIIAGDDDVELDIVGCDEVAHLSQALANQVAKLNEQLVDLTLEVEHRRTSEAGLRIFQNMADGVTELISFVDRSYIYRAVNEAYCLYHDLEKPKIIGHTIAELHGQNIFEELIKPVIDRALAGEASRYEAWFNFAGKGRRFVLVEYRPLLNKDDIIDGVVVAVHDLTHRKISEDQLAQRLREMAFIARLSRSLSPNLEFEQLLALAFNEVAEYVSCDLAMLYVLDGGQLVLKEIFPAKERPLGDVHQIGTCLCGLAAEGKTVHSLDILQDARCTLNECKEAGIRSFAALPLKTKDKIFGVLGVASKATHDYAAQIDFLQILAATVAIGWQNIELYQKIKESVRERELQIEDLGRAEKALQQVHSELEERVRLRTVDLDEARRALLNLVDDMNQANEKLKELDRLKSMFIASMSHELRTPLNSVIGFSAILKDEWLGPLNDEQKINLEAILRSGKHLLSLINDVIDISKIEAGTIEPEITEFDLDEVMQEAVSSLKGEAEGRGLTLKLESFSLMIISDRRRLLQVILNLVSNAVKFTKQGSLFLAVRLLADREKIEIKVTDTGIGISPEDIGKLFKPFSRLHDAGQSEYPGTGLGLYLCKKIAGDILGGTIEVESIVGRGSVFYVTIPVRREWRLPAANNPF